MEDASPNALGTNQNISDSALKLTNLINNYRRFGHLAANIDPLELSSATNHHLLSIDTYAIKDKSEKYLTSDDHHSAFNCQDANEILQNLKTTYCSNISYEFDHINNDEELKWLYNNVEQTKQNSNLVTDKEKAALEQLHDAVSFEQMLHKKFPGAKRFSVEGGEAVMLSIEVIINQSLQDKVIDLELGMAHRGRLNVLTNIMKKALF